MIVRENLNENNFNRKTDPRQTLNVGFPAMVKNAMEKAGISESGYKILPGGVIIPFPQSKYRYISSNFLEAALSLMKKPARNLVTNLAGESTSNIEVSKAIEDAYNSGIPVSSISKAIESYAEGKNSKSQAIITLAKLARDQDKIDFDEEYNTYIFIGYHDHFPVEINGKTYYEDKFAAEKMIKIDPYSASDLTMVSGMSVRAKSHGFPSAAGVYMVKIPKEIMDEKYYNGIPEGLEDIVDKYKQRIA